MHRPRVRTRPTTGTRPATLALGLSLALAPAALGACSSSSGSSTTVGASAGSSAGSGSSASSTTGAVDAPSPGDLLAKTKAAVESAKSSHVSGTVEDSGKPITVDVAGRADGSSAQGSVSTDGANIEFILVGGSTYIRGDQKFWTQAGAPAARASELASSKKWVKATAAEAKSFTDLANPKALLGDLLGSSASSLTQKVEATSVDGAPAWSLKDRIGSDDAELDVLKASYLPARLAIGKGQSLSFTEWDAVAAPKAPAASEIISG